MGKQRTKAIKMNQASLSQFCVEGGFNNLDGNVLICRGSWRQQHFKSPDNFCSLSLEIGCGRGEYTIALATMYPQNFYIGLPKNKSLPSDQPDCKLQVWTRKVQGFGQVSARLKARD
mmetsp:Transcript_89793/g.239923  ORF Transcript_89793/g.239923 Transcript_89793/m.239923 type:complete len:117 (-) Transcript_89793:1175-1525(-)